jgi:hypothetical protein
MKIKEIVNSKIKEGDYFSHDDPEYSDWHKFARLQDLYDLVDDGGNYDKEEVEAEVKWLRKELDMHPSERRGVSADTYKKGWSPHGHNARLENINEECGEGEYYCRKSGMCKPIPDGYIVTDDGTLEPSHMGYAEFEESLTGPTRMDVQKYFDKEEGLLRARINATEKALKIHNMKVDAKGTVQSFKEDIEEAEYKGRKVKLNDPIRTSENPKKKFKVYVKNEKGNVVVVRFGDPDMEIKRDDPERRKSFRARHNCADPGPKWKARYWSCYQWRAGKKVDEVATAGSTSAGNIAAVNNPHVTNPYRKKGKKKHPKPVSVSALDDKTSSIFGGPLRRL